MVKSYSKNNYEECVSVKYEAVLKWMCFIHDEEGVLNKDLKEEMLDFIVELTDFRPLVPIDDKLCQFNFTIEDTDDIIHINTIVEIPISKYYNKMHNFYYNTSVEGRIKDLCFIINLAYPGLLHITDGTIYRNGEPISKDFKYYSDTLESACEYNVWPKIEELKIEDCWNWINNKTNFLNDISRNPIDRALHALSYYTSDENTYIFYVLLGIEALYNNGSTKEDSILEQLRRKTKVLLGEYPTDQEKYVKKQIDEMYRMRSLLVHGNSNIEKSWNTFDSTNEEVDKYLGQRIPVIFATAILLSTIQKFIKCNANIITETINVKLE